MRNIIKSVTLALVMASTAASLIVNESPASAADKAVKVDRKKVADHLAEHQTYPATKAELVVACKDLMDFSAEEKAWFVAKLPDGTYKSAKDVLKALGIK
jgi:hypothetical protein